MLSPLARKMMVLTAISAGSLLLNASDAQAFFGRRGGHQVCASSCYAPTYCPPQCDTSCVDQCVVYRWDWCCRQWVTDSVYPAYCGDLWRAEWQARQRVHQLQSCGISAYSRCFVARSDVYKYNPWTCCWEIYRTGLTPQDAAQEVWRLQCCGICAYSTCYLVPVYTAEAAPSSQAAPTSQAAP
ncbi:MAG: hypothetical protein ABI353_01060, partial [Isosphaeraceae bacterium]